jgi:hypothetical protein
VGNLKFHYLLLLASLANTASAAETQLKAAEVLQLVPVAYSNTGKIHSRLQNFDDIYTWDSTTGKQTQALTFPGQASSYYYYVPAKTEFSADGSMMLANVPLQAPPYTQLRLVNLDDSKAKAYTIPETRQFTNLPRFSNDGQYYAIGGKLDPTNYSMGQSLWTLNLNEYLWDLEQGSAQPTGYYMETVHKGNEPGKTANYYYTYPDAIGAVAWSNDNNQLAYVLTTYDTTRYGYGTTTLRLHDFSTRKSKEIMAVAAVGRIEWPKGDKLYYLATSSSGYNAYQIFRADMTKKTSESIVTDTVTLETFGVTEDGKYLTYSPSTGTGGYGPVATSTKPATLYDVDNKKAYALTGVASGRFSADGKSIVLQKIKNDPSKPAKPFWIANVQELMDAASGSSIDVSAMGSKVSESGEALLSYEPPTDKADFDKAFELKDFASNISSTYFYMSSNVRNTSDKYFTFDFKTYNTMKCSLYDETGKLLATNSTTASPLPGGYSNKITLGPKRDMAVYCNLYVSATYTAGTKGKLVMEITGWEKSGTWEKEVNL